MLKVDGLRLVAKNIDLSLTLFFYDLFPELSESGHGIILFEMICDRFVWILIVFLSNNSDVFDD